MVHCNSEVWASISTLTGFTDFAFPIWGLILCLSKSSFEAFSYLSEECEALIRYFPFASKHFFPVENVQIMKTQIYPYLTISQAVKEENREALPKKGGQ